MDNSNSAFNPRYFGGETESSKKEVENIVNRLARYKVRHLVRFIKQIPPQGVLLDIGCGKGKTVRIIQSLRPDIKIIATDITDTSAFLPTGTIFHQASADDIAEVCAENSVDAVVSEHVIEHILYPNKKFENIFKVLKPGGTVFIETPNWTRLFLPFSPLYFWNDYTHVHPYSATALRRAFIEYGFEEQYVESVSSIEFGRRFFHTRIENGQIKTGLPAAQVVFKPKDSLARKLWNAVLDLTIHPIARDILIGVAKKPPYVV